MKLLFLASRLNPNKTSCGLLACKLLSILEQDVSLEIKVLTFDPDLKLEKRETGNGIQYLQRTDFYAEKQSQLNKLAGTVFSFIKKNVPWIHNKINASFAYLTGYNVYAQLEIWKWKQNIESILKQEKVDLIFCYGAGHDFYCHMAMTKIKISIPWVANYHDPYPASLFPPPYNSFTPIISTRQERAHFRILEKATILSFPCTRLRDWVLAENKALHSKSYILPHAGCQLENLQHLPDDQKVVVDKHKFTILHTGTLLSARNPIALIHAFARFLDSDTIRKEKAELILIGNVHPKIREELETNVSNNVKVITERLSYSRCLELSIDSTILLIVEAKSKISPFFPGKLADYLWLKKPILALSPEVSTTRDMIGDEFCSFIEDEDRMVEILESLWLQWRSNVLKVDYSAQLQEILPPSILEKFRLILNSTATVNYSKK